MTLGQQWRKFICDPTSPGRFLSNVGRGSQEAVAEDIEPEVLERFLTNLTARAASTELLAEAVDLSYRGYSDFCKDHLRSLLDSLANERVGQEIVVGPALRGNPRWDRTALARRTARIPSTHFVTRLPNRSFSLPENELVRWLVGSLTRGVDSLERAVRSRALPSRLSVLRDTCRDALSHQWFEQVLPPQRTTQAMVSAARHQRIPGYRIAAKLAERRTAREAPTRDAQWLRTLDLLRANWLAPENTDDLFELYALTLVLDVLQRELALGKPYEYGLAVSGRDHVAAFSATDGNDVFVFFDQSPQTTIGSASRYRGIVEAHQNLKGSGRRPDITVARRMPGIGWIAALVEVKRTRDREYISDSIYKALGYAYDFQDLWETWPTCPKVILLLPENVSPRPEADLSTLDVVLIPSLDRMTLARALSSRLGLPILGELGCSDVGVVDHR